MFCPAGSLQKGALWQEGHHPVEILLDPWRTVHHGDHEQNLLNSDVHWYTFSDMLTPLIMNCRFLASRDCRVIFKGFQALPANIMADNPEVGVAALMVACHRALIIPCIQERFPELIAKTMAWLGAWIAWLLFLPPALRERCPMLDAFLMESLRALSSQQGARSLLVPMNSFSVKLGNFDAWIECFQEEIESKWCLWPYLRV